MKTVWIAGAALAALLWVACSSPGFEPIVVDVSKEKDKNKAAGPTSPAPPAATATPGIVPAPTSEPPPVPTAAPPPPPARSPVPAAASPAHSSPAAPEAVAHAREDAYNRHDLDALAALYAPDARVFEPPDRLRDSGSSSIREAYARSFSMAPDARVHVTEAMTQGNLTVVRETSTGAGTTRSSLRILEVRDGRIAMEWILR